jgi:antitoxin Phd
MHTWPVQDAKARFSEFLTACLTEGPQMVTKRGAAAAVLIPLRDWQRLQAVVRPSRKQLLMQKETRTTGLVAARGKAKRRNPQQLD